MTHADGTQSIESVLVTTIVNRISEDALPFMARAESVGEHYAISYQRPLSSPITTPRQQTQAATLPADVQQIFGSFQLLSYQDAVPPLGGNEVFDQSTTPSSS